METTSEIVDSASHDCPLATQTYGTAAAKGAYVPSSPTRLGKGQDANLEGNLALASGVLPYCAVPGVAASHEAMGQGFHPRPVKVNS